MERLFIAYFENGDDIGDIRVLADIADICGMDGVEAARMLESDTDIALVEREDQIAHEMGVTGVPAMIFGGKLAVSGAREPEMLLSVIDRVAAMSAGRANPQAKPRRKKIRTDARILAAERVRGVTHSGVKRRPSGRIRHNFIAAGALGPIERLVGAVQQGVGGIALAFRLGDADGDGDV